MGVIEVLLLEESRFSRECLAALISSIPSVLRIYQASDFEGASEILSKAQVDLIIKGTCGNDLKTISSLKEIYQVPIIVISDYQGDAFIIALIKLGVNGILLKTNTDKEEIINSIETILNGGKYFDRKVKSLLEKNLGSIDTFPSLLLSPRERELIHHFNEGLTAKQIAYKTNLSIHTVESYRKSLLQKTKCPSTVAFLSFAFRNGLIC